MWECELNVGKMHTCLQYSCGSKIEICNVRAYNLKIHCNSQFHINFSCFSGWAGENCDTCKKLNGCKHGSCENQPNSCKCDPYWAGVLCDQPICE